jgi:pimeloyl-ACP methyl ester carboxylesterase
MNQFLPAALLSVAISITYAGASPVAAQVPAPAAAHAGTAAAPFTVQRTGAGRPMILIPGLLSGGEVWNGTVARFSDAYDMHVLTLAGFAGTPSSGADPFLQNTRDAVIRYIRDQKLDRPIIVGHSLGGFLAFWIAATEPSLVGAVIAVDGVPYLGSLGDTTMTAAKAAGQAAMIRTMFSGMTPAALSAQTRMALTAQVHDTAWHAVGARWGAASDPAVAGMAISEMMTTDIRDQVARIEAPVLLFMAGDGMTDDQRSMVAARYRAQVAGIRNARVVEVPNARHFIMIDEPAFFYDTMATFLSGAPR